MQGVVRTGDLMYDCFLQYRQKAKTEVLDRLGIQSKQYVLATIHREENADNPQRVQSILRALTVLPLPVIFPVHPRTRPKVEAWLAGGESLGGVRLIGPVGYLEMLALENARPLHPDRLGRRAARGVLRRGSNRHSPRDHGMVRNRG